MVHHASSELAPFDDSLMATRAAVDIVANRAATRVTIHSGACAEILARTRAFARSAGVIVESISRTDCAGWDIVIRARPTPTDG